ncbi:MAG TPA: Fe-S cluster assembly protein HesB [Dehalococcoidia bacterium]|nr:Fe-S cluster assembly protein HesB [Dehalococcoidia bacterium]
MNIPEINQLLAGEYGDRRWRRHHDPLSELIATILSQNTSDVNSGRAFASLVDTFGNCEEVARADVAEIAAAIRSGGLSQIKAARIKEILRLIWEERGSLDLTFLDGVPISEARAWLRELPGVGPKTAGCVLLFSLGKPVLPVDTHVYRVARRLGLIANSVSMEQAHELLEAMVPPDDIYLFHMNLVEHGRRVCRSQRPRCAECVLRQICPSWGISP